MRQDRKLNGWILISAIMGVLAGLVLLVAGGALGTAGFLWKEKLLKITDLQLFLSQDWIIEAQKVILKGKILKTEFLYLVVACILAVVGLITLILSIITLNYAKKRKVVRRRVALIIFAIISLAIAGGVFYLWIEYKKFTGKLVDTDNVMYICYGITGVFGFIGLTKILGVLFGRSEKFMSNDNNKYAFNNPASRNPNPETNVNNGINVNANVNADNSVNNADQQGYMSQAEEKLVAQQNGMPPRPMPNGQMPPRPMSNGQMPPRPGMPPRPMPNGQMPPRPGMPPRPMPNGQMPPKPEQNKPKVYCKRCGKLMQNGEMFCSLCGWKVTE